MTTLRGTPNSHNNSGMGLAPYWLKIARKTSKPRKKFHLQAEGRFDLRRAEAKSRRTGLPRGFHNGNGGDQRAAFARKNSSERVPNGT